MYIRNRWVFYKKAWNPILLSIILLKSLYSCFLHKLSCIQVSYHYRKSQKKKIIHRKIQDKIKRIHKKHNKHRSALFFWLSIVPVFAVILYGSYIICSLLYGSKTCQLCRKRKLKQYTNDASVVFLDLDGNIRLPTKKCWDVLVLPLYTPQPAQA